MPFVARKNILVDAALVGDVVHVLVIAQELGDAPFQRGTVAFRIPVFVEEDSPWQPLHQLAAQDGERRLDPIHHMLEIVPQVVTVLVVLVRGHVVENVPTVAVGNPL